MLVSFHALGPLSHVVAVVTWMAPPSDPPSVSHDPEGFVASDDSIGLDGLFSIDALGVQMVSIDRATWRRLQPPDPEPPSLPPPWPAARDVTITPVEDGVLVRAQWTLRSFEPGWFDATLVEVDDDVRIRAVTVDGRPASAAIEAGAGPRAVRVAAEVDDETRVGLTFFVKHDASRGPIRLPLMQAVQGVARLTGSDADAWRFVDDGGQPVLAGGSPGVSWAAQELLVAHVPEAGNQPVATGRLALATVGIGVTVGEAETRTRARVAWSLRRGELDTVSLRVTGAGKDLQVEGPNVRTWRREGDRITVELGQTVRDRVQLELSWSRPTPTGTEGWLPLPVIEVEGAYRSEGALQVARDGEVEVFPDLDAWTPRANSQLPAWAEGLVEGTPTAAFTGAPRTGGDLGLLRFEPVQGPPAVVDVAHYDLALSAEGRLIGQVRYEVRNDRRAFLRIDPPAGVEIIGVRVAAEVVAPIRDEGNAWLVPLRRSVETVDGLISFPVEVALLGTPELDVPGRRRLFRKIDDELPLPAVDVPVAAQRVRLHLPPRWRSRLDPGDDGTVSAFSEGEGIAYGFSAGDGRGQMADELFQSAVADWLDNDFDEAQAKLDELAQLGAANENLVRLQSNLDLVRADDPAPTDQDSTGYQLDGANIDDGISLAGTTGAESGYAAEETESKPRSKSKAKKQASGQQAIVARRVRQQARARSGEQRREMKKNADKARELRAEGRYDEAEHAYGEALALGDELANLEDDTSMEQVVDNRRLRAELDALAEQRVQQQKVANVGNRIDEKRVASAPRSEQSAQPPKLNEADAAALAKDDASRDFTATVQFDSSRTRGEADPADVTVYDFEDDDLDGELLTPEGASIAARARAGDGGRDLADLEGPTLAGEVDLEPEPESEPEPMPEPMPESDADEPADRERVRVTAASSSSRAMGGRRSRSRSFKRRGGRRAKKSEATAAPDASDTFASTTSPSAGPGGGDPNAALEAPVVTASGLAVVVPTIGEAVLYQQLLIPAGRRPTVSIDARAIPRWRRR